MAVTSETMIDRLNKVLDSRPEEIPDEERVNENYLRLQIANAITFIKQQEKALKLERTRIGRAIKVINSLGRLIANLGYRKIGEVYGQDYTHTSLSECLCCGHQPVLQESSYEAGCWLVKCPKCDLSTDPKERIVDALKAWNRNEFSETSEMFNRRYSKDTIDEAGMMELAKEACRIAAEDYMVGSEMTKKDIEKFLRENSFLMRLDRDALIEKLRAEVAEKQKEGA